MSSFVKATKSKSKLRMSLIGPSGSGKTYTALNIASVLADGGEVAVIDSERGSASKYAGRFSFDVAELESYAPKEYVRLIQEASQRYAVVIVDSLSHAWAGKDGALEMADRATVRGGNKFSAWREVTPEHNKLVDAILTAPAHIICTMRSKVEYVQEKDDRGKTTIRKVGMQPVQREGMEYEFDVIGDLDQEHNLVIGKTRCDALDGQVYKKAGKEIAGILRQWLSDGVEPAPRLPTFVAPTAAATDWAAVKAEWIARMDSAGPALSGLVDGLKAAMAGAPDDVVKELRNKYSEAAKKNQRAVA